MEGSVGPGRLTSEALRWQLASRRHPGGPKPFPSTFSTAGPVAAPAWAEWQLPAQLVKGAHGQGLLRTAVPVPVLRPGLGLGVWPALSSGLRHAHALAHWLLRPRG